MIIKKTSASKLRAKLSGELAPEYSFDYSRAKPNRFAKGTRPESVAVLLDPDVAAVFDSGESVNAVLRALMATMPSGRGSSRR